MEHRVLIKSSDRRPHQPPGQVKDWFCVVCERGYYPRRCWHDDDLCDDCASDAFWLGVLSHGLGLSRKNNAFRLEWMALATHPTTNWPALHEQWEAGFAYAESKTNPVV